MKKDRNCMGGMPMYQPNMAMPIPQPIPYQYPTNYSNDTLEQQVNNLQQRINKLEEKVNTLEGKYQANYSNKYNDSNYYML